MNAFIQQLFQTGIYKRSQGRITRQVTFGALAAGIAVGLYRLSSTVMMGSAPTWRFGLPGLLLIVAVWAVYRVVNVPAFADFLIAVEAEMNKVSWPTRHELIRASIVVLVTMFGLTVALWGFDVVWHVIFQWLRITG